MLTRTELLALIDEGDDEIRTLEFANIVAFIATQCDAARAPVADRVRAAGVGRGILDGRGEVVRPLTNRDRDALAQEVYGDYHAGRVASYEMERLRAAVTPGRRPSAYRLRELVRDALVAGAPAFRIVLVTGLSRADVVWASDGLIRQ